MQPLSERVRRFYLYLFVGLFLLILPLVIFYADGWRYRSAYGFVRTGGIYVSVPYADATISVNGEEIGRSGFLEHSFYLSDLAPSAFIVHVEREGYRSWDRVLVVEERLVTDARTILLPQEIPTLRILAATTSPANTSTSTSIVARATYNAYLAAFASTTAASSTVPLDSADGIGLFLIKNTLFARWIDEGAFPPSKFCAQPSVCVPEIPLAENAITSARFFRGGVVYATKDGGIYFTEIDIRQTPLTVKLYSAKGADLRIVNDTLIVKTGNSLLEIVL